MSAEEANDSPVVFALGQSPERIAEARRFWLQVTHVFAVALGGLIVLAFSFIEMITANDMWWMLGIALGMTAVFWIGGHVCVNSAAFGQSDVREVELGGDAVIFRCRDGAEERIPYAHFLGAFAVYGPAQNFDYEHLRLALTNGDDLYPIPGSDSPGEVMEELADAICERLRPIHGGCLGGREFCREYRRRQKAAAYSKWKLAFLWLVAGGMLFLTIFMETEARRENAILSGGVVATGLVSEIGFNRRDCWVRYTFRDAREMAYSGQGRLKESYARRLPKFGPIDIVYLPEDPARNLPKDFHTGYPLAARVFFGMIVGFSLLAVALISSGYDIVYMRGKWGMVRRSELEEEWWERTHGRAPESPGRP